MAYAKQNKGENYTGTDWQFYKFGPWSQNVNARIEPTLAAIGAYKKTFPSKYGNKEDCIRWQMTNDFLLDEIERKMPLSIISCLQKDIHKFGQDTSSLLHYVYQTSPMLLAAPNELLDFSHLKTFKKSTKRDICETKTLSVKKKKKLKEKIRTLRSLSSKKLEDRRKNSLVKPPMIPRYDDVYIEGLKWLDSLAGSKINEGEKDAVFSNSIWKSPARSGK